MIGGSKDSINIWLYLGLFMLIIQIFLGGITRLTGSGLSITRWDIVTGIYFPISEESWREQFDLYKATPQFQKINSAFSLNDFKFIYFWEYFHRLWARLMGLCFVFPFFYFLFKKKLDSVLIKRLLILVLLAAFVASLGWIMVSSGLIHRPWVNAYKLSFHLVAAVITVAYLLWIIVKRSLAKSLMGPRDRTLNRMLLATNILLFLQIFIGGVVAGMKAAIVAPTWPLIQGKWIPDEAFNVTSYSLYVFGDYEISAAGPLIVQFWHRSLAYLIFGFMIFVLYRIYKRYGDRYKNWIGCAILLLSLQVILGILTLINSVGAIPIWFAVFHQIVGIVLFLYCLFFYWKIGAENKHT